MSSEDNAEFETNQTESFVIGDGYDQEAESIPISNTDHARVVSESDRDQLSIELLGLLDDDSKLKLEKEFSSAAKLSDTDRSYLRASPLFSFWDHENFSDFVSQQNHISIRKFEFKDLIANEEDTRQNIILLRSGCMYVWIKVTRDQIGKYQSSLEKYSSNFSSPNFDSAKRQYLKNQKIHLDNEHTEYMSRYQDFKLTRSERRVVDDLGDLITVEAIKLADNDDGSMNRPKSVKFANVRTSYSVKPVSAHTRIKSAVDVTRRTLPARPNTVFKMNSKFQDTVKLNQRKPLNLLYDDDNDDDDDEDEDELVNQEDPQAARKASENNALTLFKTKYPEIWNEYFRPNPVSLDSCFLRLFKLNAGQMFGLSEYVHDEDRDAERITGIPLRINLTRSFKVKMHLSHYESEEAALEQEENKYHVVAYSKQVECYFVNKLAYLKCMYSMTGDKRVASAYIDRLRVSFPKLQTGREINEKFFHNLLWGMHKRKSVEKHMLHVHNRKTASKLRVLDRPIQQQRATSVKPNTRRCSAAAGGETTSLTTGNSSSSNYFMNRRLVDYYFSLSSLSNK